MVYEQRAPLDYLAGTLSTAAAISDTALVSSSFAALPTTLSTTRYLPLVLHDPSAGLYEVVWATAHSSSSTTVTAARAREGSTARAWPSGTHVVCSPTVRDAVGTSTLAGLPTDAHTGARLLVTDKGYVAERVLGAWAPSVGPALADHIGPDRTGANPPSSGTILLRAGYSTGISDSTTGQFPVTYRQAFPNATIAVMITPVGVLGDAVTFLSTAAETAFGFTCMAWKVSVITPYTTNAVGGTFFKVHYIAIGY